MIEQLNNAIVFYSFYSSLGLGTTGLTVTCDIYKNGSSLSTGNACTEVGGGIYKYSLASGSVNAEGEYIAVFKTATTTVDQQHIPAIWVINKAGIENLDAATSTRLAPTTAGRTLDVSATGEAGVDWANVGSPTTTVGLSGTTVGAVTNAPDNASITAIKAKTDNLPSDPAAQSAIEAAIAAIPSAPTVGQIDTQLSATHGAGAWGAGTLGAGAISTTVTVTVSGLPRDGVEVWLTTDSAGLNVVASGISDAMGHITFMLDAGTYYAWKQLSGINFTNPETLVVS